MKTIFAATEVKPGFMRVMSRLLIRTKVAAAPLYRRPLGQLHELGTARQWAADAAAVLALAAAVLLGLMLL